MGKLIDIGRIVVILRGRRAGKKAVVVDIIDENFVMITGPKELNGVKRRRMNVDHLMPLSVKLDIPRGASDEEVLKAIKDRGLEDLLKEEVRIPAHRL
ncbi:MAG: 50S ribosomal protein L14e [Candidatus Njordarchaeales archaeon]